MRALAAEIPRSATPQTARSSRTRAPSSGPAQAPRSTGTASAWRCVIAWALRLPSRAPGIF